MMTFSLPDAPDVRVLALGAELKNTICRVRRGVAEVSDVHGDLMESANYLRFLAAVREARDVLEEPYVLAHDLHPTYLSTAFAQAQPQPCLAIQHHHAHAVSGALDAGVALPVIGIVCDGTGYGTDGAIWGGEILRCDFTSFQRMGHLRYFALPGGDAAAKFNWRPALALLAQAMPDLWKDRLPTPFEAIDPRQLRIVNRQIESRLFAPPTSSLGRLFDAASFLAGTCVHNTFEGQAAIALQEAAQGRLGRPYPFDLQEKAEGLELDWRSMIDRLIQDGREGVPAEEMSARFHATVVEMFASGAEWACGRTSMSRVVLSGGCFLNSLLRQGLIDELSERGIEVATHRQVSTGDAGISLGQAAIAVCSAASIPVTS